MNSHGIRFAFTSEKFLIRFSPIHFFFYRTDTSLSISLFASLTLFIPALRKLCTNVVPLFYRNLVNVLKKFARLRERVVERLLVVNQFGDYFVDRRARAYS